MSYIENGVWRAQLSNEHQGFDEQFSFYKNERDSAAGDSWYRSLWPDLMRAQAQVLACMKSILQIGVAANFPNGKHQAIPIPMTVSASTALWSTPNTSPWRPTPSDKSAPFSYPIYLCGRLGWKDGTCDEKIPSNFLLVLIINLLNDLDWRDIFQSYNYNINFRLTPSQASFNKLRVHHRSHRQR